VVFDLLDRCVYSGGDGDMMKAMGADIGTIDKMTSITDGMQGYKSLQANLTAQTDPFVGKQLDTQNTNYYNGNPEDRGVPPTHDIVTGYQNFNGYSCLTDKIVMASSCVSGAKASTAGNADPNQFKADAAGYCIKYSTLEATNSEYDARYGAADCGGTNKNAELKRTIAAMKKNRVNLKAFMDSYGAYYTKETAVFTSMKNSITKLNNIVAKVQDAVDQLSVLQGSFTQVVSCKIMNKEVILLENVLCYRIGNDFYQQNNLGVALGVILFFYAWCMCCGIRLSKVEESKKDAGSNYQDNYPQQQNQQFDFKGDGYT